MTYTRCDVKTMCYIVFISHTLHWRGIKIALQEYVIKCFITYIRCDVKAMFYIVFISHALNWRSIKVASL